MKTRDPAQDARAPSARLREVPRVRQRKGEDRRRWFAATGADLYVWQAGAVITRFEFCYGKPADEHVIAWDRTLGLRHGRIDDGEAGRVPVSPLVVKDGEFDPATIAMAFERVGASLEPRVYRFVLRQILCGRSLPTPPERADDD